MNPFAKFEETGLPDIEKFHSALSDNDVSPNDYRHAQDVWDRYGIWNMGDYRNLYLKTDVLLLADVFAKNFKMCA